ncbi:MAG: hypothetical protein U1E26_07895 [Coriobacteriia bacterium]|nr:hypothetical protein [Coriobacteriia bacterium]
MGIGDTVHLVISLSNLGPKSCDAKLNYKIPVGLKLLSSQGPGVYDVACGVWNAGLLLVNDSVSLDLVLQAMNIGYFVNMVSVYGDLTSTHAVAAKPIVKVFNGKWRSTAAMSDSNGGNNKASFSLDVRSPTYQTPSHEYKWPDDVPKPDKQPDLKPPWDPQPKVSNDQLPRDIRSVRDVVSGVKDAKIANWNMTIKQPEPTNEELTENEIFWLKLTGELVIGVATALVPNEWLQGVNNAIMNSLRTVGNIAKYFGLGKQVKTISNTIQRYHDTLYEPWAENYISKWSTAMLNLSPNLGEIILQKFLVKLFPAAENEISTIMNIISTAKFALDPFDTWNSIFNSVSDLMKFSMPNLEDLAKFLIPEIP